MENEWDDIMSNIMNVYPNYCSQTLPCLVRCAEEEHVDIVKMAFERYCPDMFNIDAVYWVKSRTKPYCRWFVKYSLKDMSKLPEEGEGLKTYFRLLEKYHPQNTRILRALRSDTAILEYGVFCNCPLPAFSGIIQSSVQFALGTLHKDFNNLEIEDTKKELIVGNAEI